MEISIIACMDLDRGIGYQNGLPWKHIPVDMNFFKTMTHNKTIIMGGNTWRSLKKSLPNRTNFVISKSHLKLQGNSVQFCSIEQCLQECKFRKLKEVFVIGGGSIYKKFIELRLCKYIYLNVVNEKHQADVYMPEFEHLYNLIDTYEKENVVFNKYELIGNK